MGHSLASVGQNSEQKPREAPAQQRCGHGAAGGSHPLAPGGVAGRTPMGDRGPPQAHPRQGQPQHRAKGWAAHARVPQLPPQQGEGRRVCFVTSHPLQAFGLALPCLRSRAASSPVPCSRRQTCSRDKPRPPALSCPAHPRLCLPAASRHSDTATRTRKTSVVITGKPWCWLGQCGNCQQRR